MIKSFRYPAVFIVVQWLVLLFARPIVRPAAYIIMVAAPLLCALALAMRARREDGVARSAWFAMALSLAIWALGAFGNLWQEWILGRENEMYRTSMLAFHLTAVPTAFVLASDWRGSSRRLARATDGLVALALGYGFFLYTWTVLTARGAPDEAGVQYMIWLLDAQNVFLTAGALVRWFAADSRRERDFFGAVSAYELCYLVFVGFNNHYIAGDPQFGPEVGAFITVPFALFAGLALAPTRAAAISRPHPGLVRTVRGASPMMLAGALLIVSLFVIREDYLPGVAGVLIAVGGYGARTTLNQVRHIERGDILQRQRSELETIAWSDALTGLPNRHYIERVLTRVMRGEKPPGQLLSVLMVDIDYFKLLNDRYGHPAGDVCLRDVAHALKSAMVRPQDVVARYGGEEFIALLNDADAAGAMTVAERIRTAVEALAIENSGSPLSVVTVSVGAASSLRETRTTTEALVSLADRALYEAKNAGRNQIKGLSVEGS